MRFKVINIFLFISMLLYSVSHASVKVQCPGDTNGDAQWTGSEVRPPNTDCIHLAAGDGFITMADGHPQYMFGFSNVTGLPEDMVMMHGMLAGEFPAPTIKVREGNIVYLTLTNVGMMMRPDLFDPHTVHWHGFANAAPVFDGEPMGSIAINMGSSLTYYYRAPEPGTYLYHCHVEATEHMQMGMLGNLYVTPLQDGTLVGGCASRKYAYNDGDGSTCYDVDFPIQIHGFDSNFHDKHIAVQPLPFAMMKDNYPMLNGRGYPDTVNPAPLPAPAENGGKVSQRVSSKITAVRGQKILLRLSSLATVDFYTLSVLGIPMKVVGKDARILRSTAGENLSYTTNSVTLGGGQACDVILDTAGIAPGTYFLYATDIHNLSNNEEDYGGMMTEIELL
ncbi:multicopper oxidase domain-containing protein [Geobacter sp. DSM 9736]|uniref:multicopper oxidase domain-containing protein n=1 Tax=Geobacter sp. DSM 9736 TaxID=1277350 RepID=UPI000B50EBE7|nr:multicopper oxidase domain-containing protein [Geobacter sp. DSM 9736]SNB47981.1 Multicopper oxidase [Geobacter sp. DSM 9736]